MDLSYTLLKIVGIISAGIIVTMIYAGSFDGGYKPPPRRSPKFSDQISTPKHDKLTVGGEKSAPSEPVQIPPEKIITPERMVPEPPPPPPRKAPPAKREKNVCEQHHMVKVVTNNGRSWRCRRRHHD